MRKVMVCLVALFGAGCDVETGDVDQQAADIAYARANELAELTLSAESAQTMRRERQAKAEPGTASKIERCDEALQNADAAHAQQRTRFVKLMSGIDQNVPGPVPEEYMSFLRECAEWEWRG